MKFMHPTKLASLAPDRKFRMGLVMNTLRRTCVAGMVASIGFLPAHACYSVEVENTSGRDLEVIWRAEGCIRIHENYLEVCSHKPLSGDGSVSHNFGFGTTGPVVIVRDPNKSSKGESYTTWSYSYKDGGFRSSLLRGDPPHCAEHYKIHFTYETWSSK